MISKFFTNSSGNSLFNKFQGIIENMTNLYAFHAVIGYFRSSGYFALQEHLKNVNEIKILVGINVDQMFAEAQRKGILFFADQEKTKEEFLNWFVQDIKEAKYSKEVEDGIAQFITDLISGKIEVRAHTSQSIHAKFYLFLPEHHSEHSDGWVIMGSSNLTDAGLGIKKSPNYEMNIALKDYDDVAFAREEFKNLWEKSTSILPADLMAYKNKTHIGNHFTPFELYLKFLIEYFGKNIDYDPDTVGDLPRTYKKLSYQIDAVNQGFQMLMEHNGFFLSDVVGLGKTVVATMIAKRFLIANGSLNTKILVVYPPALEKNWKTTFRQFGIDRHTKFITNGSLEKIIDCKDLNYWAKEDYDLILVDEAHRYRNHTSTMFSNLQRICKASRNGEGLVAGAKKKVMLISATPLNNRPQDLYYQLLLFQDARRSTLSVGNLQKYFGPIIQEYRSIMKDDKPNIKRIQKMYGEIREKIISEITVRRTRKDLNNYPKYNEDLKKEGIIFPEIAPPRAKIYELNSSLSKLFYKTIFYVTDEDKINFYRYQAIRYLKADIQKEYYEQAILVSKSLASIIKTLMVKRLESSFTAFKASLEKLTIATGRMIEMFDNGKILVAPDLKVNDLMDKGLELEEIEALIEELGITNPRNRVFSPDDFQEEFIVGLKKDHQLLNQLLNEWSRVNEDPKLDSFFNAVDNEFFNSSINPTGKLVIFTESADTANYLQRQMEQHLSVRILNVSAKNRNKLFDIIQQNFDANYPNEHKDVYNILITTDVLAEGVNLHRANMIVNYDTPWNATRLMQRFGRVNRIGSVAGVVYSFNYYPSQQGDDEIKLYRNALVKLQSFHSAFGEDAQIFTHEELIEQFKLFKEGGNDEEDKRLLYLRFIRDFKDNNPLEFKRIKQLPLKARVARSISNGVNKNLKEGTAAFLKSPYKMDFYQVLPKGDVKTLTFLEAAAIFECKPSEPAVTMPERHYSEVQKALDTFEDEFFATATDTVVVTEKADAVSAQAKKYLRNIRAITRNDDVKNVCDSLIALIDKGVHTPLPNEVRKLKKKQEKKEFTFAQIDNLLLLLAKKYDAYEDEEISTKDLNLELDMTVAPSIVISETFTI